MKAQNKLTIKSQVTLDLQKMHELATLFVAFGNDDSSPSSFEMFCRDAVKKYGVEGCGMHSENGYCDFTDRSINEASNFLVQHYSCAGMVRISKYGEDPVDINLKLFCYDVYRSSK